MEVFDRRSERSIGLDRDDPGHSLSQADPFIGKSDKGGNASAL